MKVITFKDITNLNISPDTCYTWVEEMLKNKGKVLLPPKISMKPSEEVFCNVMPCMMPYGKEECAGGIKVVTRYPDREPSLDSQLLLFDGETGEWKALMDANWITTMRTGAVAAHSILLLGKKGFSEIGMLGLGNTARATLLVLASLLPDREFHIKLYRYKGQEVVFAKRFEAYNNLHFSYVESYEEVVKGSEVVISAATYFAEDICNDDCFEEGVLVVPVHTRGFSNCDLFFDKVYADDYGHVHHFKNFDKFRYFAEVADVVNGAAVGRENDKERILAYNIGLSMHDVNFASHIYELLQNRAELQEIDMCTPVEKFWI